MSTIPPVQWCFSSFTFFHFKCDYTAEYRLLPRMLSLPVMHISYMAQHWPRRKYLRVFSSIEVVLVNTHTQTCLKTKVSVDDSRVIEIVMKECVVLSESSFKKYMWLTWNTHFCSCRIYIHMWFFVTVECDQLCQNQSIHIVEHVFSKTNTYIRPDKSLMELPFTMTFWILTYWLIVHTS